MSDENKAKKKATDDYMAGLSGGDAYVKAPTTKPLQKTAKFDMPAEKQDKKEEVKQEVKPQVVAPKVPEKKPELPKVVVPKFIKKDSQLEKDIVKVIQEVPREELEKILKPTKEAKERLVNMDFQNRDDMSEEEKRDFIEQIAKKEPEPEIAEMNGALVWKWQKNRRIQNKKETKS